MDQRPLFIADHARNLISMSELCDRYGIIRKTGYKWIARYQLKGPEGFVERSHPPFGCPHGNPPEIIGGLWEVSFGPLRLKQINKRDLRIEDDRGCKKRENV
jgi:transposase-like protein